MARPKAEQEAVLVDRDLEWEPFKEAGYSRALVPGGWLVRVIEYGTIALTFVPDKEHTWSHD